jgi:hypothetical protein
LTPNHPIQRTARQCRWRVPSPLRGLAAADRERVCRACGSCLGVKLPRPGVRGAEGQGKRQGVTVRWGRKEAWNEGAGRGPRTGYEVWDARDAWARNHEVLHPQLGCTLSIRRLCPDGMTADRGRAAGCPGEGLRAEESSLTASQKSADGRVPPARMGRPKRAKGVGIAGGGARWHPARR